MEYFSTPLKMRRQHDFMGRHDIPQSLEVAVTLHENNTAEV